MVKSFQAVTLHLLPFRTVGTILKNSSGDYTNTSQAFSWTRYLAPVPQQSAFYSIQSLQTEFFSVRAHHSKLWVILSIRSHFLCGHIEPLDDGFTRNGCFCGPEFLYKILSNRAFSHTLRSSVSMHFREMVTWRVRGPPSLHAKSLCFTSHIIGPQPAFSIFAILSIALLARPPSCAGFHFFRNRSAIVTWEVQSFFQWSLRPRDPSVDTDIYFSLYYVPLQVDHTFLHASRPIPQSMDQSWTVILYLRSLIFLDLLRYYQYWNSWRNCPSIPLKTNAYNFSGQKHLLTTRT